MKISLEGQQWVSLLLREEKKKHCEVPPIAEVG